jgi:hypothetical protein
MPGLGDQPHLLEPGLATGTLGNVLANLPLQFRGEFSSRVSIG